MKVKKKEKKLEFNEIFYCPECKEKKTDLTVNHGIKNQCVKCGTDVENL